MFHNLCWVGAKLELTNNTYLPHRVEHELNWKMCVSRSEGWEVEILRFKILGHYYTFFQIPSFPFWPRGNSYILSHPSSIPIPCRDVGDSPQMAKVTLTFGHWSQFQRQSHWGKKWRHITLGILLLESWMNENYTLIVDKISIIFKLYGLGKRHVSAPSLGLVDLIPIHNTYDLVWLTLLITNPFSCNEPGDLIAKLRMKLFESAKLTMWSSRLWEENCQSL